METKASPFDYKVEENFGLEEVLYGIVCYVCFLFFYNFFFFGFLAIVFSFV